MSESTNTVKHTPGPWTIIPAEEYCGDDPDLDGSFTRPASVEGSDGNPVCTFGSEDGSGALFENDGDYHLIAAAPDLLEALKLVADSGKFACFDDAAWDVVNAAISKATGSPAHQEKGM